jgi:23S rRNA (pseudouridine1915-N3)-methyltransferase
VLKVSIFAVSTLRQRFIREGEQEYSTRLKRFLKLSFHDVKSFEATSPNSEAAKIKEGVELLKRIPTSAYLIVLAEQGKLLTSIKFAEFLKQRMNHGDSEIAIAIGGPSGWSAEVLKRADFVWSLSPLTFTAQLARLLCLEQLYRAMNILQGTPYHKE